jgi:RNA polymerase sigma factor (sigma-70 family)
VKSAASGALAVTNALTAVMAEDRGRILAALIAKLNNFQLAEDALHEAATSALSHWGRTGLPHSPKAWLLTVANRKAIDIIRKRNRDSQKAVDFAYLQPDIIDDEDDIADERLRLIFTCCHPGLELKSQLALTLRTIAGLSTREIARAFVDQEQNIGQRISRVKAKISAANIPFIVPGPEEWPQRLQSVLAVIYLIFTTGYTSGGITRRDLAEEAIFLAGLVNQLRPGDAESEGCLALLIITHSRRAARVDT